MTEKVTGGKLKVGVVCYPTYGGSGVVATELGQAMAMQGHEIHFITYKRPARLSMFQPNVYYHEVSNFEYPLFDFKPYDTALASKIVDIALHHELDLLHVHYAIPHAIIAFIAKSILKSRNINLPVITTLHGTDITLVGLDASFYPVVQFSLNQSDHVTAVSESLRRDTISAFRIDKTVEVIPNFIDRSRFKICPQPELRKIFAGEKEKILMHVSNFRKVKRIEDIVRCYARVNQSIPSRLILIGDGPERMALEDLCRELRISEKVIFLGKQESIETLLNIADLFMLTSDHESFGLSALEAMSCGVPVVSSDIGGIPEVNKNGFSGYTCAVGDVDGLTEKAIYILSDEQRLADFRHNAVRQAEKFELNQILPKYLDLYRRALAAK